MAAVLISFRYIRSANEGTSPGQLIGDILIHSICDLFWLWSFVHTLTDTLGGKCVLLNITKGKAVVMGVLP